MNGRMLSRAIHRTSPATMVAEIRTATRGESGANRRSPGPAVGSMNGGSGRPATHRARSVEGPSATEGAGSSMVPQTTRRGTTVRPRDPAGGGAARRDRGGASGEPGEAPVAAPRQRWRLVLARDATAPELAGRELGDAWDAAIAATGLPVYRPAGRNRPALAFGAPVPSRMALEGELADLVLTAMLPTWAVRESLIGNAPPGWRLIGLFDVWLGTPALAGQVAAADYRIEIDGVDAAERGGSHPVGAGGPIAAAGAPEGRRRAWPMTSVRCWPTWPSRIRVRRWSSGSGRGSTRSLATAARRRWSRRSARRPAATVAVRFDRPRAADHPARATPT